MPAECRTCRREASDAGRASLPTIRRAPHALRTLAEAFGSERFPIRWRWLGERELNFDLYEREVECAWTSGSFMIVRREALESAGSSTSASSLRGGNGFLPSDQDGGVGDRHLPMMTILHHADEGGVNPTMEAQAAYARRQFACKNLGSVPSCGVPLGAGPPPCDASGVRRSGRRACAAAPSGIAPGAPNARGSRPAALRATTAGRVLGDPRSLRSRPRSQPRLAIRLGPWSAARRFCSIGRRSRRPRVGRWGHVRDLRSRPGGGEPRPVVAPDVLDRMTDAMTHRGPNDRGTYLADGVALGVRRLSIVDVEGGHQPFANEDGTVWAVQNGELYNHARGPRASSSATGTASRAAATPRSCRTSTRRHGDRFPEQLRGMFGIAVWDGRERRAVIARDRLGIKPLYYARAGDLLVFASELKSLLASGLVDARARLRGDRRVTSRSASSPGPMTPLAGVRSCMPGHLLVVDRTGVRVGAVLGAIPSPRPSARADARGVRGAAARGARGVGAAAADERRAARRDAQRRPRLEPDRRADGAAHERAGEDVLGRLRRGRRGQRARRRAPRRRRTSAPTTTSSSSRSPSRPSTSSELVWHSTSRSPISRRSASSRSPSSLRGT